MFDDDGRDEMIEPGHSAEWPGVDVVPPADGFAVAEGHGRTVSFYFPVEVVVIGALRDADRELLEARIWENLYDAIERTT